MALGTIAVGARVPSPSPRRSAARVSSSGLVVSSRGRQRGRRSARTPRCARPARRERRGGARLRRAVAKLSEHMEGALADEFSHTLGEMRIGESRQDALKKLAGAQAPRWRSFTRSIIQADQPASQLGRILRVQAADTRLKRQAPRRTGDEGADQDALRPSSSSSRRCSSSSSGPRSPACRALLMTATEHETEGGFGTGLRAQLQAARRGLAAADAKPIPAPAESPVGWAKPGESAMRPPRSGRVGETFALSPWAGTHSEIDAMLSPRSARSTPGREVAALEGRSSGSCSSPPRRSGGGGAAAPCGATAAHSRGRGTRAGEREADLISSASCRRPIVSAPSPLRSSRSRRRLLRSANARSSVPRPSWLRVRQAGERAGPGVGRRDAGVGAPGA